MANKKIKFLGITVYKRKTKGNKTKTYILGLPVWKKVSANNKKKYYLLGFRVWKRKFCSKIDDTGITISQSLTKKIYNSNCRILFNQNKILAHNNEKIRIIGQGKSGINGGKNGDLFIKVKIGIPRIPHTLNNFLVCASTPLEASITITAESAAIRVR